MWIYPDNYNPWRIVAYFAFIPVCLIINALLRSFGLLEPRCQRCRGICTKHEELRKQVTADADGVGVTVWTCPHCGWRREREYRIERPVVSRTLKDARKLLQARYGSDRVDVRTLLRARFGRTEDEILDDDPAQERSTVPSAPVPHYLTTDDDSDGVARRRRIVGALSITAALVGFVLLRNFGLLALAAVSPALLYGAALIAFTHDPLPPGDSDHSQPWRNGHETRRRRSRTRSGE